MATRILIIIACVLAGMSAIISLTIGFTKKFDMRIIRTKIYIMLASFVCEIAGVSVGVVWALNTHGALGVAAIIAIIATFASPVIVVVSCSYWLERRPMLTPALSTLSETASAIFVTK